MNKNHKWLSRADLSMYEGEWIIVANESVVAHGKDLEALYKQVDAECPDADRITINVPPKGVYVL